MKVIELGSLSAAGRASGLSPASVSRQINALEQSLGVRLINRTSRRLTLTEVGQMYRDRGTEILGQLDELTDRVSTHQASPRGVIHVHARISVSERFVLPALPGFLAAYPDVKIRLWLSEEHRDVIQNNIDVAIRLGNLDEPLLAARRLAHGMPRLLFASPAYLAGHSPILTPSDLLQHNCLTWPLDGRFEDGHAIWSFREGTIVRDIRVYGNIVINNSEMLKRAALADMGVALLPSWYIADEIAAGALIPILPHIEVTPTTFDHHIYAVFQRAAHMPPKVRAFIDHLVQFNRGAGHAVPVG